MISDYTFSVKHTSMEHPIKVVVFDLDFTLWDAGGVWCDCTHPPFHRAPTGQVYDSVGREIRLYEESLDILERMQSRGMQIALASRTSEPGWANQLTRMLGIDPYVNYREIYPGSKISHLSNIRRDAGVDFSEMLFFDDEHRNIEEASSIGVRSIHVPNGVHQALVQDALEQLAV